MRVLVKSFGCAANQAEGEIMSGLLRKEHELTSSVEDAEQIVLNVCTVKGTKTAMREIRAVAEQHPDKKLVIAGCVTEDLASEIRKRYENASLLGTHHAPKVLKLVSKGAPRQELLGFATPQKLGLPRARQNPIVGIVPISQGCMDACAFCSTRLVKGRLQSYPVSDIVNEVKASVADGCKEIWLTGQDTCCYGFDIGTDLPNLLEAVLAVQGDFMVRLGMGNPRHVPKYLNRLISVFQHPKLFKFLHIPLQSGSNTVLKRMLRGHSVDTVRNIISALRETIPDMTFSTDIIVGFPGETGEEFQETVQVVRELEFDVVNLARFAARPGTRAYTMPNQIHGNIAKERSRALTKLYRDITLKRNQRWLNRQGEILIDERGKHNSSIGRNAAYKPVVVRGTFEKGQRLMVRITGVEWSFLRGELLGELS